MECYISVKVSRKDTGKIMFDRVIPHCDLDSLRFSEVIRVLHCLFSDCCVIVESALPKKI